MSPIRSPRHLCEPLSSINKRMLRTKEILHISGLLLLILPLGCNSKNKSTDIYSYQIQDKTHKLEKLSKYLTKESGIIDAEYHIWYQDNGTGRVPGPSDYNIRIALKIQRDSVDSWISHLEPSSRQISNKNWKDLKLDTKKWSLESEPKLYHSA